MKKTKIILGSLQVIPLLTVPFISAKCESQQEKAYPKERILLRNLIIKNKSYIENETEKINKKINEASVKINNFLDSNKVTESQDFLEAKNLQKEINTRMHDNISLTYSTSNNNGNEEYKTKQMKYSEWIQETKNLKEKINDNKIKMLSYKKIQDRLLSFEKVVNETDKENLSEIGKDLKSLLSSSKNNILKINDDLIKKINILIEKDTNYLNQIEQGLDSWYQINLEVLQSQYNSKMDLIHTPIKNVYNDYKNLLKLKDKNSFEKERINLEIYYWLRKKNNNDLIKLFMEIENLGLTEALQILLKK
ncbi:hypothetical protein [Mycoplasma sp. Mirounga ES2805-ORL]|uniref:hypothetical protein n=1 Tax=Mycoplasma sp. Mirounga ES2805-ORL TaxID=754514 RepID=UPI00197C221B|nr:hypothetical protein [Mycoplasma sp. Mirounga ES2805-ORL]QSF13796.1 hypothetical protein JXZ90_00635 [Mycoplasma sp. Mirounga ES2805-ORL]